MISSANFGLFTFLVAQFSCLFTWWIVKSL